MHIALSVPPLMSLLLRQADAFLSAYTESWKNRVMTIMMIVSTLVCLTITIGGYIMLNSLFLRFIKWIY